MFTSKRSNFIALVVCLLMLGSIVLAKPARYVTIDYPGAVHTFVLGINPAGDMVGAYDDASGYEHGFALRNGEFRSFDWPDSTWTDAFGINPRGDIVGQYGWHDTVTGANVTRGFLLIGEDFYPIDVEGQQNTMPYKISPNGAITGCIHHNNALGGTDLNTMMGFTLDSAGVVGTTMVRSMNLGINPAGDTVGYYYGTPTGTPSNRPEWSYLIRDGVNTFFQYPGAFATFAMDINPAGTIVGRYRTSATPAVFHGFVLKEGSFETFDVPGAAQTYPFGISATGDIVGYYFADGVGHGFLMTRRSAE